MENNGQNQGKIKQAEIWTKLVDFGLEFAIIIAGPLIGGIYLGKWLDAKYHQKFFVVIGILSALFLSCYIIYKKIKEVKDLMK